MKSIKLLKDHEHHGILHKAGEIIEVDDASYDWLMQVYLSERRKLVGQIKSVDKVLKESKNDS
jgi:hypothetical protein